MFKCKFDFVVISFKISIFALVNTTHFVFFTIPNAL